MISVGDFHSWFVEQGVVIYGATPLPRTAELGFDFEAYQKAMALGYNAEMAFLASRFAERCDPSMVLEGARGAILVAFPYGELLSCAVPEESCAPGELRLADLVAGFAQVDNYHYAVRTALENLAQKIANVVGPEFRWRAIVDSAPFLEKAHARLCGLGSVGNNTLILTRAHGSAFVLGVLLVSEEVAPFSSTDPADIPTCGACRRCIEACPTGAIVAPRVLDARKCRAYLSVEHRGPVPPEYISTFATTVFGCDLCQVVCPHTRAALRRGAPQATFLRRVEWNDFDIVTLATLSRRDFDRLFGATSLARARHDGMVRNALYHLYATKNPDFPRVLSHWKETESHNIRAVVEQLQGL